MGDALVGLLVVIADRLGATAPLLGSTTACNLGNAARGTVGGDQGDTFGRMRGCSRRTEPVAINAERSIAMAERKDTSWRAA